MTDKHRTFIKWNTTYFPNYVQMQTDRSPTNDIIVMSSTRHIFLLFTIYIVNSYLLFAILKQIDKS
jgi:hypothetical protein